VKQVAFRHGECIGVKRSLDVGYVRFDFLLLLAAPGLTWTGRK
jgi:hypothetical protein